MNRVFNSIGLTILAMTSWVGASDTAFAQSCTVAGDSTVTLTSGTCAIDPNTSLTGTPAVHASTSAQITTNNVNINPFNGGSIGGLADTNGTFMWRAAFLRESCADGAGKFKKTISCS